MIVSSKTPRFHGGIPVDELIKGRDISNLNREIPAVDEHGQTGAID